jgi:serine/threonine protein kinase/formylglycine-generating enzyme required for sulfatase activity
MQFRCPNCQHPIRVDGGAGSPDDATMDLIECPSCHSRFELSGDGDETVVPNKGFQIGHFEIREVLGEGSYGTVYKAWDSELKRFAALKVPRAGRITKETSKMFLREARAVADIHHPNVVSVFEVGLHEGRYYIASQYIDGVTLAEWLKTHKLEPRKAAELLMTLLRAVQVFHDKGIVHRDLKPGNILLDQQGEPYVADFGLARSENPNELTVTESGRIIGTLNYMSPEQAKGEQRQVTALSDVYAMGVILYETLTGRKPFRASSSRTLLYAILTDDPPHPRRVDPKIPRDLQTICLKAMEKDGSKRYQTAGQMADDLQRYLKGEPILAVPPGPVTRATKWIRRHVALSVVSAFALFLLITVAISLLRPGVSVRTDLQTEHVVQLECKPGDTVDETDADCRWAILPLDPGTREPLPDQRLRRDGGSVQVLQLPPGEYLIVVEMAGVGFHEVYRYVPEDPVADYKPVYAHQRWEFSADGKVLLPAIHVHETSEVSSGMQLVKGGEFLMGDDSQLRPLHRRSVDTFYVDRHEVTVAEYRRWRGNLPVDYPPTLAIDGLAVCHVSWDAATAFAEAVGKRLPKEHEYEYLATDLGTKSINAANAALVNVVPWSYGLVSESSDQIQSADVYGLFSDVAEWTDSLNNPYPGAPDFGILADEFQGKAQNRIVRGGPVTLGPNDRATNQWSHPVTHRWGWHVQTMDTEIGFRCVLSAEPRYLDDAE